MAQGTWRVDPGENRELQIESGVDRNKLLGNAKKTAGKRKLPHPKVLSYPVAVTPEENNGSRLLIKCFEYLPPKNILTYGGKTKTAKKKFTDTYGNKYKIGDELLGEDKKPLLYPTNVGMKSFGASDRISRSGVSSLYYVELPIPQDVNDSNTVTWGDSSLNILQLAGLAVTQGFLNRPGATFNEIRGLITDGMLDENSGLSPELRNSLSAIIAGKAIDNLGGQIRPNQALGRATGEILNTNLELLFDSVNLRSFPFSITFSPRNQVESMRVKHIIRAFKSSMAAKRKSSKSDSPQGGIFLKAPDVFHLRYLHNGKDHPFLNSFKHCALTGMSVNYTNAGTFASYSDGTPVSIQMNLTFKELNPIYQEDYEGLSANDSAGVGF
tara:strand:- start:694 stop:1842 length:1149 start_codon:yes stop_codon:yes gene_type:complete